MKKVIKKIIAVFYAPLVLHYLKKERTTKTPVGILLIKAGVFHPKFFFSTQFLLQYLKTVALNNKTFLELGAGSGLLSFYAAKQGAKVTATDISKMAIEGLLHNKKQLQLAVEVIHSNLFLNIPQQTFNYILINPPYYPKSPKTESEMAWYCGADYEYFAALFKQLGAFVNPTSVVLMSLSEDCNLTQICKIAGQHCFTLTLVKEKRIFWERNCIFSITKQTNAQ